MNIRPATHDDVPAIVSFTTDTFAWGDYVPSVIDTWIDDPDGRTIVADIGGVPVAVARSVLLSDDEAWAHGARVAPEHRGKRIAADLADDLMAWAEGRGAKVVRLLIEDDNEASIRHIERVGFRRAARVQLAHRTVGEAAVDPSGNGVRRGPSSLTAKPGKAQDAPIVMTSWNASTVGRAMRGLIGKGWQFRSLHLPDVVAAAESGDLWEVGGSWAITSETAPRFHVALVDTRPEDAYETTRALVEAANERGAESFSMWIPNIPWAVQAVRRTGCDVAPSSVWVHALGPTLPTSGGT